jgi:hypothetical protein
LICTGVRRNLATCGTNQSKQKGDLRVLDSSPRAPSEVASSAPTPCGESRRMKKKKLGLCREELKRRLRRSFFFFFIKNYEEDQEEEASSSLSRIKKQI